MEISTDTLLRVREIFDRHYTRCPICGSHRVCFQSTLYEFKPYSPTSEIGASENDKQVPAFPIVCMDCSFLFWMKVAETSEPYETIAANP